ncbi:4'-phosphopantetheinyl transferase family protein [Collimonas pratensis]|uniref:4'-phosphopantetheinyl transferase superfamily protein n=1 Tax=Collimonas pratensis TaxID=279113 RepID=A0A127Q430_9BURK|nr:4'-phosphopantetheinyl transferase superfamily protein [Collimonas pratensis]AMP04828.1 4'-phosphopantetheinyl transferase superfamily protein [Collimonas pratensis]
MPSAVIWLLDANALSENDCDGLPAYLSEPELLRYRRFLRPLRQREFLLGRMVLRFAIAQLTGIAFEAIEMIERQGRAPRLQLPPACSLTPHFSVSHSRGWVACAASVDTPLGVDIEAQDGGRDVEALARSAFSAAESDWLSGLPADQKTEAFYALWSSKEALYKLMSNQDEEAVLPELVATGLRLQSGPGWHARNWSQQGFSLSFCSRDPLAAVEQHRLYGAASDGWRQQLGV